MGGKKKEAKEKPLEKMTAKELRDLAKEIPGITGAHGMNKPELLTEIKKTRKRGHALSEEEYLPGLIAIGAPLRDPVTGEGVGAVSFDFSVLQHDARRIETEFAEKIVETAETLSELLPAGKPQR